MPLSRARRARLRSRPRRSGLVPVEARLTVPLTDFKRRPPFVPPRPCASVVLIHHRPRASIEAMFTFSSSLFSLIRFTHTALPCLLRRCAAPRQAMPSTSHQAKLCRSYRLMFAFASSEHAPSSCCRVTNSSEPPAESGYISSTVSTRATPGTSLTKPVSTSPSHPTYRCRLPAARLHHCGQCPMSSRQFRLCLKLVPHRFLMLSRPTPDPRCWQVVENRPTPLTSCHGLPVPCFGNGPPTRVGPAGFGPSAQ
jgi:hypothetical protein